MKKISLMPIVLCAVIASFLGQDLVAETPKKPELEFPQASPSATVKERVGVTAVDIEYGRPSVKGRKIFGGLVPYGEVWRTGANSATKVTFGTEVNFGGTQVPAGSYALFTIPESGEWTVILNKADGQWGSYAYDAKNDIARVKVKPVALTESLETMTISLGDLRDDAAILNITWDMFLIFTVFMSSEFCGIAKMASEMKWVGERTIFDRSNLRQKFMLQWVAWYVVFAIHERAMLHP